tara:strand:+ start:1958 stop:2095 length:138 start_codon:yes stop_codon:yes gene_type:complete
MTISIPQMRRPKPISHSYIPHLVWNMAKIGLFGAYYGVSDEGLWH